MNETQQPRPERCPKCGSPRVAALLYGLPNDFDELNPRIDAEEIVLGGCSVWDDSPQWHCCACHHEWGVTEWRAYLLESKSRQEAVEAAKDAEARARGTLTAIVRADGSARCPYCGTRFSTLFRGTWDGQRHEHCGSYLTLIFEEPSV